MKRNRKLAEKRAIDYERNKTAKYVLMFLGGFVIVYLIFFAVIFSLVANESTSETAIAAKFTTR